ncbi:mCG146101, partial [Mus musculus]
VLETQFLRRNNLFQSNQKPQPHTEPGRLVKSQTAKQWDTMIKGVSFEIRQCELHHLPHVSHLCSNSCFYLYCGVRTSSGGARL